MNFKNGKHHSDDELTDLSSGNPFSVSITNTAGCSNTSTDYVAIMAGTSTQSGTTISTSETITFEATDFTLCSGQEIAWAVSTDADGAITDMAGLQTAIDNGWVYPSTGLNTFDAIHCGGFTEEELSKEIFGNDMTASKLESCQNGSLVFHEIHLLPLKLQQRLYETIVSGELNYSNVALNVRFFATCSEDLESLVDKGEFNKDLFDVIFKDEVEKIRTEVGVDNIKDTKFTRAIKLFEQLVVTETFEEFLTLPAYQYI